MHGKIKTALLSKPDWFAYLFFLIITLVLTLPVILDHEAPNYIDQMGHLFRVWFLTDAVQEGHFLPQWLPHWYNGMDTFRYYPPLSTYLMLPFNIITDSPVDTYYIFGALLIFVTCITSYQLAREFMGRIASVITALLYTFSSLTIASYWFEGNFGRTIVAAITPLVFLFAYRTLRTCGRGSFIGLAVSTALLVLGHGMQAAMTLIVLAPWLIIIGLLPEKRWRGLIAVGAGAVLGIGLSLFWLFPATTHFDLSNVPGIYIDKLIIFSTGLESMNLNQFHNNVFANTNYLSLALVVTAVIGAMLAFRSRLRWLVLGFTIAIFIGILLSFGIKLGDWYASLPVLKSFMPLRFYLSVLLPICMLAGMGLQLVFQNISIAKFSLRQISSLVLVVALLVFMIWDYLPAYSLISAGRESPQEEFSKFLAMESAPGKVIVFTNEDAAGSYWPTVIGSKRQVFGWAIEGSIQNTQFPQMNVAIANNDNSYLGHLFTLWQVNYALLGGDLITYHQGRLVEMGFRQVATNGEDPGMPYVLMARQEPLPPAFSFSQNVIAVGVGAAGLNRHFPWITRGNSETLENYDIEFLRQFDIVVLWEPIINDIQHFETIVAELTSAGTDIYISPGRLLGDFAFGISSAKIPMSGMYRVENEVLSSGSLENEPGLTLPTDWYGHVYDGLDGTELVLENSNRAIPLLQYKLVNGEKVYFIGAAALCLLDTSSIDSIKSILIEDILARSNPNTAPNLTPLVSEAAIGIDAMTLDIIVAEDSRVVLSESYSPSWRISVDGNPIKYYNLENMLSFYLPAGEYTLDFRYGMTTTQVISLVLSAISLLVLLAIVFLMKDWLLDRSSEN